MAHQRDHGGPAGAGIEPLTTVRVASGLNRPVFATHAPSDFSRLFIVEQRGVIKILDLATETVLATPFLDIDALVAGPVNSFDERGLLGLAFHPDYQTNGFFYVNYTRNVGSDTVVARYTVSANPDIADLGSGVTILTIGQPFTNHNGGWMGFGPNDGFLYIATGDGGFFCDPGQRAQDLTNQLLGKMLRIIPSTTVGLGGYTIPPDNPFVGVTGDDEIWAYGLRNPWRNSFDRETGDLYIADVGQNAREEIDYQPAASGGRENYGWDCKEGTACANSVSPDCVGTVNGCSCGDPTLVNPIHQYTHAVGFSITGGYVYRGCAIPSLHGTYFFADFVITHIWSFSFDGTSVSNFVERTSELSPSSDGIAVNQIASFGEDAAGEIYIVDRGGTTTGQVFKIVPASITDCNENGVPDACDIATGNSPDVNGNGIPDECESPADLSGPLGVPDGCVDAFDLGAMLGAWCSAVNDPNPPSPPCENCTPTNLAVADISGAANVPDGCVDAFDLARLLAEWCSVAGGNPCGTCGP
ncbi:MAG: PQQ-dependent sugar dehydrogenase [Planctomycetes bacterium]|nr:PQQ-dependent sugar dehydrogenase [Planctomycetota bacterium]